MMGLHKFLEITIHMYLLKHSKKYRQLSLVHLMMPKMIISQTITLATS